MVYCYVNALFVSFIVLSSLHGVKSMKCDFDHEPSLLDKINIVDIKTCPTLFDNPDNKYCCVDNGRVYCCSSAQFISTSISGLLPILIAVAVGFLVACCLCCFCCPCCLLYKRRHRGTIYSRVQTVVATPQTVQQQAPVYPPQPTQMAGYSQTAAYPLYSAQTGQQPPPYSEATAGEVYSKQAPYNPHFQ